MEPGLTEYIKPGEFTFCSRCGNTVHIGNADFTCMMCREISGRAKYLEYEESELIKQFREKLANVRLRFGKGKV